MSRIMNIVLMTILQTCFILNVVNGGKSSHDLHTTRRGCQEGKVECLCGNPPKEKIKYFVLDRHLATPIDLAVADCSNIPARTAFCAHMSCSLLNYTSTLPEMSNNKTKRSRAETTHLPIKVVLPPADAIQSYGPQRPRRFPKTCNNTLKSLKNAEITCWFWDNYVTCDVTCVHGYALREDSKVYKNTTRTCRETDNYWSPKPTFPVCEPYMNCKAVLVKPGDLKCKTSTKFPPYCEISCFADVEHDEISTKRYDCVDDKFAKILPHCAGVDKNLVLIERPKQLFTNSNVSIESNLI